ncbi:hypothetical protein E0L36_20415 [Streptomyces sp. AJS327]|uniref:hypothetical protein n=1 Tax=Streptomyces sp. AJS327 TaxID=2545265 RepID=UPI0015DD9881|nr:hypothetical protein [Streptomyces sp. AJS327]MBA0053149.1 hypothetical protein [Streptomyces sp. AJS327]
MNAETPTPGDLLVRVGGIVFALGALATVVTVAPLFLGTEPFPAPAYFVCMLMGLGFALAGAGLLRSMLVQRRAVAAAASATGTTDTPASTAPTPGAPSA